jgi:hypothetical protein
MFKSALQQKLDLFAVFRKQSAARAAVMFRSGETLFFDGVKAVYLSVGKKVARFALKCVAVVPEEEIFYKIVSVPADKDAAAALAEAAAALPLRVEDALLEHFEIQPLAAEPGHKDFALWAVSRQYLVNCRKIAQAAGVVIADFLPESIGLVKTIFTGFETNGAALIIAVSGSRSVFTVFAGRAIHFSGVLALGSKALEAENSETEDRFLSEILQAVLWYKNRASHEHGASHSINSIFILGSVPERVMERIALNTQLRVQAPDVLRGADAAFAPLIGALKNKK